MWFGATIFLSALLSALIVLSVGSPHRRWIDRVEGIERFTRDRFAEVWNDAPRRRSLAQAVATDLAIPLTLRDADGRVFERYGAECRSRVHRLEVRVSGQLLGYLEACSDDYQVEHGTAFWVVLFVGMFLWVGSRFIARWLTRPLAELINVARELGEGNLQARFRLGRFGRSELAILANAVNDMASRIEKQIRDQRELLAAVSHEIRTPLGHLRILIETAQDRGGAGVDHLASLEGEVLAIDALVGQLLARSRVDFGSLEMRSLVAADLALLAAERAGLDPQILDVCDGDTRLFGDAASLLAALANLLRNGEEHGGGVRALRVEADAKRVHFRVEDGGLGFRDEEERLNCFESFRSGHGRAGSLGLGLSLVKRIARAHGGDAWAENRDEGGAAVGFYVSRGKRP